MKIASYIKLIRPHHWAKNFFIFAALIFAGNLFLMQDLFLTIAVFVIFCMACSSVYIFNDFIDLEYDRKHPKKRFRPIASKEIPQSFAYFFMIILMLLAIVFSYFINLYVLLTIIVYILLNIFYTLWLKHKPIIDLIIVSLGYVLRVVIGAVAIDVELSPWIIAATFTLAMFITIAKRFSEARRPGIKRTSIKKYNVFFLSFMLFIFSTLSIVIYLFWCIENRLNLNQNLLILSSVFVIYGIVRYMYLSIVEKKAESPANIFVKDFPIIINIGLWGVYMTALIYFDKIIAIMLHIL